jgi:hypothetical protein
MGTLIDLLMPKAAKINRAFGAIWMLLVGQFAIVFAALTKNSSMQLELYQIVLFSFFLAFIASYFFWKDGSKELSVWESREIVKSILVLVIVTTFCSVGWFPTQNLKFDALATWLILCWILQLVGLVRFGVLNNLKQ